MKKDVATLIEYRAFEFRHQHALDPIEPVNIKQVLRKLNILTLYQSLSDSFSGMCLKTKEYKFILVNSNHPRGRQHFTIAHEFYHLFVQNDYQVHACNPGINKEPQEQEADYFASVLLMPEMGIRNMVPEKELLNKQISLSTILKLEQYFSVSRSAMLVRLRSLSLMSAEQYETIKNIPVLRSALEYGYSDLALYRPGNENLVIGDYGDKARRLFDCEKISEGHYLSLLSKIGIDITAADHE